MARRFGQIEDFARDEITLPIDGTEYTIPGPDAQTGLLVTRLMTLAADAAQGADLDGDQRVELVLEDADERDLMVRVLGPAFDQMIAGNVRWSMMQHAMQTAMVWISQGSDAAELYWLSGGASGPKAPQDHKPAASRSKRTRPARQG